MEPTKISDLGEKRLISEFVAPFFNACNDLEGVGDDCAMIDGHDNQIFLMSTDRVPADLIAFRLGLIDYFGLGQYLARLNISDIAACGGIPQALLLNLGLPNDLAFEDFKSLCMGFGQVAETHGCRVLGGDISASKEVSISATSVGFVEKGKVLTRRGATIGDSIFISRPLGLTPAAFAYYLVEQQESLNLSPKDAEILTGQFTTIEPLVSLGRALSETGFCTSCMDNTDGVGQSLLELSIASHVAFVIDLQKLQVPALVETIAKQVQQDATHLAFSAGADFSLIGTLRGHWTQTQAESQYGFDVKIIGYVDSGDGVYLETATERRKLLFSPWNYFV